MLNEKLTDKANTLCLYRILAQYSDEEHVLTMREIMAKFDEDYSMKIDRRTVYSSIETLKKLGYDVSDYEENRRGYYLRTRLFEPSEVRLMMDAVYSLNSIPQKQTTDLVEPAASINGSSTAICSLRSRTKRRRTAPYSSISTNWKRRSRSTKRSSSPTCSTVSISVCIRAGRKNTSSARTAWSATTRSIICSV